jgi:hypothetical protein
VGDAGHMALEARVVVVAKAILEAHDLAGPSTQGPTSPKSSFPNMMGNQTHCRGSTNAPPTSMDERVCMASLHLDGIAAEWYYSLEHDMGPYSLECYVGPIPCQRFSDFVNMRFGPPLHHNGLAELKDLQ